MRLLIDLLDMLPISLMTEVAEQATSEGLG